LDFCSQSVKELFIIEKREPVRDKCVDEAELELLVEVCLNQFPGCLGLEPLKYVGTNFIIESAW
jgi:hypothetical protein